MTVEGAIERPPVTSLYLAQPRIETKRLILEPVQEKDVSDIWDYASNPEIERFVTWYSHRSLNDSRAFYEWMKSSTSHARGRIQFHFVLRLKKNRKVIGTISFKNVKADSGQIDYALSALHWRKGMMTEAASAVRDWAFQTLPELKSLRANCMVENVGSAGVMKKIGMKFQEIRPRSLEVKGQMVDMAYYSISRDEWSAQFSNQAASLKTSRD